MFRQYNIDLKNIYMKQYDKQDGPVVPLILGEQGTAGGDGTAVSLLLLPKLESWDAETTTALLSKPVTQLLQSVSIGVVIVFRL